MNASLLLEELESRCVLSVSSVPPPEAVLVSSNEYAGRIAQEWRLDTEEKIYFWRQTAAPGHVWEDVAVDERYSGSTDGCLIKTPTIEGYTGELLTSNAYHWIEHGGEWARTVSVELREVITDPRLASDEAMIQAGGDFEVELLPVILAGMGEGEGFLLPPETFVAFGDGGWYSPYMSTAQLPFEGQAADIVDLGNGFFAKTWEQDGDAVFAWSDIGELWSVWMF